MGWTSYREDIVSRFAGATRAGTSLQTPPSGNRADGGNAVTKGGRRTEEPKMTNLKEFTAATARPLPVIVLADTSGSMSENGKIEALNTALTDMVAAFAEEEEGR